ncbi:hypothetical protein TruAng_001490 [Truncatella angustata]|nr:hypothetical protein TruAng_001490 [Truncatella angustata]
MSSQSLAADFATTVYVLPLLCLPGIGAWAVLHTKEVISTLGRVGAFVPPPRAEAEKSRASYPEHNGAVKSYRNGEGLKSSAV